MEPNLVWLTLDSVRADHTSVCGYERDTTPSMCSVADSEDGQAFQQCFAHGIWSPPSVASILTGTHPFYHGVGGPNEVLPEAIPTVPERLSEVGYRTAGLSTNPHLSDATGLSRGFDRFLNFNKSQLHRAGFKTLLRFALSLRKHSAGYTLDTAIHRPEFPVNAILKRWLSELDGDRPFFLYAHTKGAHQPYYPPDPYVSRFSDGLQMDPRDARSFVRREQGESARAIAESNDYTRDQWRAFEAMYDGIVGYVDSRFGDLFDYVQSNVSGETIVVVTSDHGDLLGEQGMLGHRVSVHDAVLHVPFVAYGWSELPENRDGIVQHVDFIRTFLEQVEADTEGIVGVDLRNDRREYAVAHRHQDRYDKVIDQITDHDPEFDTSRYHETPVTVLRSNDYKYLRSERKEELFELPDESTDVSGERPEELERFRHELDRRLEQFDDRYRSEEQAEFGPEMREQLSDLGYL